MPGHEGFDLTDFSAASVIDPSKCRPVVIPLDPANISSHGIVQHAAMLGQVYFADVTYLRVLGLLDGNLLLQLLDLPLQFPNLPLDHRLICRRPRYIHLFVLGHQRDHRVVPLQAMELTGVGFRAVERFPRDCNLEVPLCDLSCHCAAKT